LTDSYLNTNPPPLDRSIENDVNHITDSIISAANVSIGKTKPIGKNYKVIWWNPEIKQSIKNKNSALNRFQKTGETNDHIKLKQLRAKTRDLVKCSKANLWKIFISTTVL